MSSTYFHDLICASSEIERKIRFWVFYLAFLSVKIQRKYTGYKNMGGVYPSCHDIALTNYNVELYVSHLQGIGKLHKNPTYVQVLKDD